MLKPLNLVNTEALEQTNSQVLMSNYDLEDNNVIESMNTKE